MADFEEEEEEGHPITKDAIKGVIKKHNLYTTPSLNDVLYMHYYGFTKIQCLEEFINLKALWLNNNAISTIEGLDELAELKCLYLANNLIEKITGLEKLQNLDTLVLSTNFISSIDGGLSSCKNLTTLSLDHNKLKDPQGLVGLTESPLITILNISNNNIESEEFLEILKPLTKLRVLRMDGNPVTRKMKNYRRRIILAFPELKFLDDTPVTEDDRRLANVWSVGGLEAERKERDLIKKEKDDLHSENMRKFHELINNGKAKQNEENQAPEENTQNAIKNEKEETVGKEEEDESFFVTKQTIDHSPKAKSVENGNNFKTNKIKIEEIVDTNSFVIPENKGSIKIQKDDDGNDGMFDNIAIHEDDID